MSRTEHFDAVYQQSRDRLVMQLMAFSGSYADAADAVQEAFLRAWLRWERVGSYDDPEGWVRRVAYHLAVSRWRHARQLVLRPVTEQGSYELPDDGLTVITALKALPVSERRAIVLYHLGGLSVEQTAADMQAPVGTVKSWLSRGRARLRAELASQDLEVTS